jgi:serine/threonine protein kinase/Leucine-rich repeat (LRR) protein
MAVALEQFVKQLADSGVISPGKLENFVPPKAQPKDAQELARQLVQSKQLTKFQAQEIYQGRAKSLILGNYTILDKIGAGGMGQVFKAEHRRMHRVVAIKVLPRNVTKDAAAIARFQREVEAAAKLEHPNIVTAYDADEAGGVHFLVMQYVEGSDLSALVKKNGPVAVAKAVNYILQAARGLEFAHGEGVVHRDIKPANLLVDKKGTVKILDMGLARISTGDDAATQAELTGTGAVLGTVDYMAPEQALSTKHADARADIYSLGCSLHYLIAGHAAYDGDTLIAKLLAHREKPIPSLGADVPPGLQAVFDKMVAKKIEDRYQTMSEVVAAMEPCVAGQQTSASVQRSLGTDSGSDVLTFLRNVELNTVGKPARQAAAAKIGKSNKKFILGAVGAGLLSLALLLAVVFKLQTKDGTLVVEVNEPDATVQVLDEQGKIEITRPGENGPISISVDPGKHRVKVEKNGFAVFGQDFAIESGVQQSIKAKLIPLEAKSAVATTKRPLAFETPGFDQWLKQVAALPAEKQVEAVAKKLQDLNPGFDGKATAFDMTAAPKIENGVVTEFGFVTDNVTDISPVRALSGLKNLKCTGSSFGKGKLVDLLPLQGMHLTFLDCCWSQVADLSPLQGMPLWHLECGDTRVSDLSPLKGMPLTSLLCFGTQVSDLSPLKDMRLTSVLCYDSPVSDLSPLKGMPLTWLDCHHTMVFDLSPLQGMPLTFLGCGVTLVSDLSPLKGMPLTRLDCHDTTVSDLSPLQGMTLAAVLFTPINMNKGLNVIRQMDTVKTIGVGFEEKDQFPPNEFWKSYDAGEFGSTKPITTFNDPAFQQWVKGVADLSAEKQVAAVVRKLRDLNRRFDGQEGHNIENGAVMGLQFVTNDVTDLSPVRALPELRRLHCGGSDPNAAILSDLSPLKGMLLTELDCTSTRVSDLSPLKGMPLGVLFCGETNIADLSALKGMELTFLVCNETRVSDLSPIEGMSLTEVYITPKNITKGLDVLRQMKSLMTIGVDGWHKWPAAEFWKKYDAGEFGKPPIATLDDPAFQQWMKVVADMPADKQVEAVSKKLQELNPGFDGKVMPKIEGGVVTEVQFVSDNVTDISPVRAFAGLKGLACRGSGRGKGILSLLPLKGMTLTGLDCGRTKATDLSPLEGMPLTDLRCRETPVSDLSPLKGMPLKLLGCEGTKVTNLSPLGGMPLTRLSIEDTPVSDLSSLNGISLTSISLTPKNITKGIEAIRQMKSLQTIGPHWNEQFPPAEFWKKYDAGEFKN